MMIKTKSINVLNLCVPCHNHCKYCLLSYNGKLLGIDYERSIKYAKGFYEWIKNNRPDIEFIYYFGYSMDHPNLIEVIKFMQTIKSPMGEFLQLNGMKMRSKDELYIFMNELKSVGIKLIDFTFYGLNEYHDSFSGRKGDFNLMLNSLNVALDIGIKVEIGIPALKSNLNQLESLVDYFNNKNVDLYIFTPHSGGRGKYLYNDKITIEDYNNLSDNVKKYINRNNNKTPIEWLNTKLNKVENRVLTLSLIPSNMNDLETKSYKEIINELEEMDEKYYSIIPSFEELLKIYASNDDINLYSKKDLYIIYRNKFIKDNNINIFDNTDERFNNSLRY